MVALILFPEMCVIAWHMQAHMQVGLHVQFIALLQNHGIEGFFIEHYIHEIYNLITK